MSDWMLDILDSNRRNRARLLASLDTIPARFMMPNGAMAVVAKSTRPGEVYQVSTFDDAGPIGHQSARTLEDCVACLVSLGVRMPEEVPA